MDKNRFSQFEERIQALVEGGFARLFAGRLQPREVALRLARAMEDTADVDDMGNLCAPNRYAVHLHPDDHAALLETQPDLAATLAKHLIALAHESELYLDVPPEVDLVADNAVTLHAVTVQAQHAPYVRQATDVMRATDPDEIVSIADSPAMPAAFLVLDRDRYVPLARTVTNIGRRRDNHIVLDDRRVSRHHGQLRFRFGQFVLYDLASRGGTFVNNTRISECVLRSGDVISLAGVQVVFMIDDQPAGRSLTATDTQVIVIKNDDAEGGVS
ncbi:MAG: DUF3662 domain-containing protein [Chloroflexi bacterium]|nr:DUF3662 domain-containing protein [Chloroflexota bacterium]